MKKILITDGCAADALKALRASGYEVTEQFYAPDALGDALKDFDCVIIRSATSIRKAQIDAAAETGRLKLIVRAGVGIDNIDVDYAESKGIAVRNTPKASSDSVAELALAHMFACARFLSISGAQMRQGKWPKKAYANGMELRGKTLGVVGYGRIGSSLGRMCQGLGMNVLAFDYYPRKELECETMHFTDLDTLLAGSDFVSLHIPALSEKPLMDAANIAKMKDGAILVNTSRGANVDEAALLDALNAGKLRAAGLDVWAQEPSPNEALYTHPAVSCTPHIGASTREAQARVGREIVHVVSDVLGSAE